MSARIYFDQPGTYHIRVQGKLSERWAAYFDGMHITVLDGPDGFAITELKGELLDQAALQGVLQKLYNLGFPLISAEAVPALSQFSQESQERPPP
jgi:hypothetical protein